MEDGPGAVEWSLPGGEAPGGVHSAQSPEGLGLGVQGEGGGWPGPSEMLWPCVDGAVYTDGGVDGAVGSCAAGG